MFFHPGEDLFGGMGSAREADLPRKGTVTNGMSPLRVPAVGGRLHQVFFFSKRWIYIGSFSIFFGCSDLLTHPGLALRCSDPPLLCVPMALHHLQVAFTFLLGF